MKQPGPVVDKGPGAMMLEAAAHSRTHIVLALRTTAVWGLSVFLWLVCLSVGWSTLTGQGAMASALGRIGPGPWVRIVAGALELTGAIALLIPRVRFWGAIAIAATMIGTTLANIAILHATQLATLTGVLATVAVLVAILGWPEARFRRR